MDIIASPELPARLPSGRPRAARAMRRERYHPLIASPADLLRADRRLKVYVEARPQQIVRMRELHGDFGRLRGGVEFIRARDEATLVRILIARRQNEAEFTPLGDVLNAWECSAALKIHGGGRLAYHMDRV